MMLFHHRLRARLMLGLIHIRHSLISILAWLILANVFNNFSLDLGWVLIFRLHRVRSDDLVNSSNLF